MADCDAEDVSEQVLSRSHVVRELPAGEPSEGLREETLVECNAERLAQTVTWLCGAVRTIQASLIPLQSGAVAWGVGPVHPASPDTSEYRSEAPPGVEPTSEVDGGGQDSPTGESRQRAVSDRALADRVEALQRELKRLEQHTRHKEQQHEQKELAQDTLFTMQVDSLKRELETRLKAPALEEQKKLLLQKIANLEAEQKETLRALNATFQQGVTEELQRLQEQNERMCASVTAQVRVLEDSLAGGGGMRALPSREASPKAARAPNDEVVAASAPAASAEMEQAIEGLIERIVALEVASTRSDAAASTAASAAASTADQVIEFEARMQELQAELSAAKDDLGERIAKAEELASSAAASDAADVARTALAECRQLCARVDELEKFIPRIEELEANAPPADAAEWRCSVESRLQTSEARVYRVEQCTGQSPGSEVHLFDPEKENRIKVTEQLHVFRRETTRTLDSVQHELGEVKKFVGWKGSTTSPGRDPLEWLDSRIATLVDKSERREKTKVQNRISIAEDRLELVSQHMKEVREELNEVVNSNAGQKAEVTDDIWEELRRQRCIIECLEACAPKETKRAVQFFRKAGADTSRAQFPVEVQARIMDLKEDTDRKIQSHDAELKREHANLLEAVKGIEREQYIQSQKILDFDDLQPKCINLLEAICAQITTEDVDADCTGGTSGVRSQAAMKLEAALDGLRPFARHRPSSSSRPNSQSTEVTRTPSGTTKSQASTLRPGPQWVPVSQGQQGHNRLSQSQSTGRLPSLHQR